MEVVAKETILEPEDCNQIVAGSFKSAYELQPSYFYSSWAI